MRGGSYRILEPMGKGGMGALYLAADTGAFDRKCVIKELLDYYDPTDPEEARKAQARFGTEARLLAELSHPGIPRIYSFFSEAGRHFIVMEYIEGETLERAVTHVDALGRKVAARPLSPETVVRHAMRLCQVLDYLADRPTPVVHHDIKPANLIVDRTSGEVRLVDFGTAQPRLQRATEARPGQKASTLFGTAGYAAPEQYQGHSQPRSDVYALAATIYHLLTDDDPGNHPFEFPQLASLPGSVGDALGRALRQDVQRRSTAVEFRNALEAWLAPEASTEPFTFGSGAMARTTEELVDLCDQHWSQARRHLADGDFDRWFRARNRHDLVAKARSAKLEPNADAALEAFLHQLNPRLPPPKVVVEPSAIDFGRVAHSAQTLHHLKVRNAGRGYAQVQLTTSVPWLLPDPAQVGCLPRVEAVAKVYLETSKLPFQSEHHTILACTPVRGPRISIPVSVRLSLVRELLRRAASATGELMGLLRQGIAHGLGYWTRTFRSLLRSRFGRWILLGEAFVLAMLLTILWSTWRSQPADLAVLARTFLIALPAALFVVYLLPALAFVGGAAAWEILKALANKTGIVKRKPN
jgi:serine/threonine protein kinase